MSKCTHPQGHFPDNQGYCHECGVPMAYADCETFYVMFNDDDEHHYISKQKFGSYDAAKRYKRTICKDRKPKVLVEV